MYKRRDVWFANQNLLIFAIYVAFAVVILGRYLSSLLGRRPIVFLTILLLL